MSTFKLFEEIEVWQNAKELTRRIYSISKLGAFAKDFGLRDQIRRAAVSVMSNIAEGYERGGTKEFVQFLAIARGSVGEVRCQLFVALDQNYLEREEFDELFGQAKQISKMLTNLISYLQKSGFKGTKYKST